MSELAALVNPVLQLCETAAEAITRLYHAPGADAFEAKDDNSPLTQADLAAHHILQDGLAALTPSLPILSEESDARVKEQRRSWPRYWLVDPLDGTKEFLGRTGEFTINVALIDQHRAVFGIVYLPLSGQAYVGIPGELAQLHCRGQVTPLHTSALVAGQPLRVMTSSRHHGGPLEDCLATLAQQWGPIERHHAGSALKFCQLAAGEGDFYPRFAPCCEWDTGAGQAVLEAAGGALLTLQGEPLRYNRGESLYSPNFYAIADPNHALWQVLLP